MSRSSVARPAAPAWDCCHLNPSAVIEFANGEAMTVCQSCANTVPASRRHPIPTGPLPMIPVTLEKHFHVTVNGDPMGACHVGIPAAIAALKSAITTTLLECAEYIDDDTAHAARYTRDKVITPALVMALMGGVGGYYGSYTFDVAGVSHRIGYCPADDTCDAYTARTGQRDRVVYGDDDDMCAHGTYLGYPCEGCAPTTVVTSALPALVWCVRQGASRDRAWHDAHCTCGDGCTPNCESRFHEMGCLTLNPFA